MKKPQLNTGEKERDYFRVISIVKVKEKNVSFFFLLFARQFDEIDCWMNVFVLIYSSEGILHERSVPLQDLRKPRMNTSTKDRSLSERVDCILC